MIVTVFVLIVMKLSLLRILHKLGDLLIIIFPTEKCICILKDLLKNHGSVSKIDLCTNGYSGVL